MLRFKLLEQLTQPAGEQWLSLGEAAKALGVHPATLRRWANQDHITPHITPGGHRRFTRQDLLTFSNRQRKLVLTQKVESLLATHALNHTRQHIAGHQDDRWLSGIAEDDRQRKRILGQRLIGLLLQYASSVNEDEAQRLLDEVRAIGGEHARLAMAAGAPLSAALQATLFFRDALADVTVEISERTRLGQQSKVRLQGRISKVLNAFELALAETYEQEEPTLKYRQAVGAVREPPLQPPSLQDLAAR